MTGRLDSLLSVATALQQQYESSTSVAERKRNGQFFTPVEVCQYMAGLLSNKVSTSFRLLDPGAGVGSLTAAVCDQLLTLQTPRSIELHAFENDGKVIPLLQMTLQRCCEALQAGGHRASYAIHQEDFILTAAATLFDPMSLFNEPEYGKFDAIVMNPPYFKVSKDSPHARVMRDVVHGQPNMYAFFLAAGAEMLRPGGEMVAITPRSFCNGLYFREFRRWFFERMSLDHIHLFESRTDTFQDVLQESIVTASHRLGRPSNNVTISTSYGRDVLHTSSERRLPRPEVIDRTAGDAVIRIPETPEDSQIVSVVGRWTHRFSELGLRVSTGPVVTFRAREFLLADANGPDSVPLLSVFNIRPFETLWPVRHKKHPIAFRACGDSAKLLLPSLNYALLRRFSAKEEKRRLTASCFIGAESQQRQVALENHLNYVYHATRSLTVDEVYGIAALFNSTFIDRYFRTISGNTQVNATEIRTLPFPDLSTVVQLGRAVQRLGKPWPATNVEQLVLDALEVKGALGRHLLEAAS